MEQSQPSPAPVAPVGGGNKTRVDGTQGTQQQHNEATTSQHIGNNNTSVIPAEAKPMEARVSVGS